VVEIGQNLNYCMKVTGLTNIPQKEDKILLVQKLKDFFGYLHPDEIKLAFDLGIQKIFPAELNHFQNFSVIYLSGVINSYLDYRSREAAKIASNQVTELTLKSDAEKKQIQKEYDQQVILPIFEKYKIYKVVQVDLTLPKMVYKSLVEVHKIITLTPEQKRGIMIQCTARYQQEKERIKSAQVKSMTDYKKRKAFLAQIEKPEGEQAEILDMVYRYCIGLAFDIMIENNISTL
jgi:hypothetical protein